MKHGVITIINHRFSEYGYTVQDRHREYTRDFCRNTHFSDELNLFPCLFNMI